MKNELEEVDFIKLINTIHKVIKKYYSTYRVRIDFPGCHDNEYFDKELICTIIRSLDYNSEIVFDVLMNTGLLEAKSDKKDILYTSKSWRKNAAS